MLHIDTMRRERRQTPFQEQGITIASLVLAFGMFISTTDLAVTF